MSAPSQNLQLVFTYEDVFGPSRQDQAVAVVLAMFRREPIPAAAVGQSLGVSQQAACRLLGCASELGAVQPVPGKGWIPSQMVEESVN